MPSDESSAALQNFIDYTSRGGRVMATHFSYTWLYQNGGLATVGQWQPNPMPPPASPLIANVDTSTPNGADFATWLGLVGALSKQSPPQVSLINPGGDLRSVTASGGGQRWLFADSPALVQHMRVDMPVLADPDKICGRVIYSDFHVPNAMNGGLTFPTECLTTALTPQEKILASMVLALASCQEVIFTPPPPTHPPPPPPPLPPPCH